MLCIPKENVKAFFTEKCKVLGCLVTRTAKQYIDLLQQCSVVRVMAVGLLFENCNVYFYCSYSYSIEYL